MPDIVEIAEATVIDPEPTGETMAVWARHKLNCRFVWRRNDAGAPIMQVFPKDNSPVSERVQIRARAKFAVYKAVVVADGGYKYWCVVGSQAKHGKTLYVRAQDVIKVA